jgi:hypothetical protein
VGGRDTDIASLSIKDRLSPRMRTRVAALLVCVTFVTVGELTRGPVCTCGVRDREGRAELAAWLRGAVRLGYDDEIA